LKRQPKTLFTRTWLTVAAAVLAFLLFSSAIMAYYLVRPMARQSADDLAALMVLSAQVWVELPPRTRPDFEIELYQNHGVTISESKTEDLQRHALETPYMHYLEQALALRLDTTIPIQTSMDDELWLWVDIPMADRDLRFSFPHSRIGARPPAVVLWLLAGGFVATLLTSLFLVRKLNQPLEELTTAAIRLGQGGKPDPLPEKGPKEIVTLTTRFNEMMHEIHELLENRTTLLAGISHDLRTPIARIRLAIEMLNPDGDAQLIDRIKNDLTEMDDLIGRTLSFAKGLDDAVKQAGFESIELGSLIDDCVQSHKQTRIDMVSDSSGSCFVEINRMALKRVLDNLIENAIRYSEKQVSVNWRCDAEAAEVSINDQGPGIPEDQIQSVFQPFHRLENSRNRATGGSGLGLAIVEQFCIAYGWSIELKRNELGGTSAVLTIPKQ